MYATLFSHISGVWQSTAISLVARANANGLYFGPPTSRPRVPIGSQVGEITYRQYWDGYYLNFISSGPSAPYDFLWSPSAIYGMYSTSNSITIGPGSASGVELIVPRGYRYQTASPNDPAVTSYLASGASTSAWAGGAECFPGLPGGGGANPLGGVCPNLFDPTLAPRDPLQAVRTFSLSAPSADFGKRTLTGFIARAAFRDVPNNGSPLRNIPPETGLIRPELGPDQKPTAGSVENQSVDVPGDFQAWQSIFFHHVANYEGGSEYGFALKGTDGDLALYGSVDTNLSNQANHPNVYQAGFGLSLQDAFGDNNIKELMAGSAIPTPTLYFAAWVEGTGSQRMICYQVGSPLGGLSLPYVVQLTGRYCLTANDMVREEFKNQYATSNWNIEKAQRMMDELSGQSGSSGQKGYITANNAYFTSGIAAVWGLDWNFDGRRDLPRIPRDRWKKYWSVAYDMPTTWKLVIAELYGTEVW